MTDHMRRLLDLYTDYLLVSFGATTATGLSRLMPEVSHDQITRLLSQHPLTDKELWKIIKPQVRAVESPDAVLILDDSVQEKPYSDESELITWHYDHSVGRTVKGVNLLFWENVVLIEANSYESASEKASIKGKWYEENSGDITVNNRPAKFKFSGVRKIVICGYEGETPEDGMELTFSSFESRDQHNFEKFVEGEDSELIVRSEFPEDE